MKLKRLDSTTQHLGRKPVAPAQHSDDETVRRVEAAEGIEGDRQRSLQQEIAEFDAKAIGPFEGGERILQDVRDVAAQLSSLGAGADALIKTVPMTGVWRKVDDKA